MRIVFDEPVEIGFGLRMAGQRYQAIGLIEHTTRLGAVIDMMQWHSLCWDCRAPFTCKSVPTQAPETRRCPDCASPGKKTRRARNALNPGKEMGE